MGEDDTNTSPTQLFLSSLKNEIQKSQDKSVVKLYAQQAGQGKKTPRANNLRLQPRNKTQIPIAPGTLRERGGGRMNNESQE